MPDVQKNSALARNVEAKVSVLSTSSEFQRHTRNCYTVCFGKLPVKHVLACWELELWEEGLGGSDCVCSDESREASRRLTS